MCMTEPAQMAQLEQGEYTGYLSMAEDFGIGDAVGSPDVQDTSHQHVGLLQAEFLTGLKGFVQEVLQFAPLSVFSP